MNFYEEKALKLEEVINKNLFDQQQAVSAISTAVRSGAALLSDSAHPLASILIAGGRGTGKTTLAEQLALALYGDSNSLIRFDMSDFGDDSFVNSLIGAPVGYKDSEEGGRLIDAVRSKPYAVVLFDNVELAAREVRSILLKLLKDGFLIDNRGKTVSFRNCIVVLTVGIDSTSARTAGFSSESSDYSAAGIVKTGIPSELVSSVNCLTVLENVTAKAAEKAAEAELSKLAERVSRRGIDLHFDGTDAKTITSSINEKELQKSGFWAVKKAVSELAEKPVSQLILSEKLLPGHSYKFRIGRDEAELL